MEILLCALVVVAFWLVWKANQTNKFDINQDGKVDSADAKAAVSAVEQRLWEQSVANVGKDEIKVLPTPETKPAKKTAAKKPVAKKAPAKKVAAKKTPAKKTAK